MKYPQSVPGVGLVGGKFSDGDPAQGIPASLDPAQWANQVTDELLAVIAAAGLTPSEVDSTQLLQALPAALASRPEMARSLAASGYQKLPGGLIIQWGLASTNGPTSVTFPIAFPNAVTRVIAAPGQGNVTVGIGAGTTTGVNIATYAAPTGANAASNTNWIAIGY